MWNIENGITNTYILINARKLPVRYEIKELDKMRSQLEYAFVETLNNFLAKETR